MGDVLRHLHRVVDVLEQADQADPQAEAHEQAQRRSSSGRFGLIGTVGSTTLDGNLDAVAVDDLLPQDVELGQPVFHADDLLRRSSRSLSMVRIF